MVQEDVGQLWAGVEQLQQQTQAVVDQRVLIQRVLQQTQHRDDTTLPERGDVLHILQIQTERTENNGWYSTRELLCKVSLEIMQEFLEYASFCHIMFAEKNLKLYIVIIFIINILL